MEGRHGTEASFLRSEAETFFFFFPSGRPSVGGEMEGAGSPIRGP